MTKVTKASVDYSKGMKTAHCGICAHYIGRHECEIVSGKIEPDMWCKRFKRESVRGDIEKAMA